MWRSYQEAKVTAASITNGIRLFIHIPVFEYARTLTLYCIVSMTRATPNGTTGLQYVDLPAYIAASPDQQMYIELTPEMIELCRPHKSMICPIS
jgi:hypothetical protein